VGKKISKYSLDTCYTQSRKLIEEAVIYDADYNYPRFNRCEKYPDGFYAETVVFLWGGTRVYSYTKRRCSTDVWTPYYIPKTRRFFQHSFHKYTHTEKRRLSERQAF